jgi:hypothetical protein
MQYLMLIYQGDTPYPGRAAWAALSEAEQKAFYEARCHVMDPLGDLCTVAVVAGATEDDAYLDHR